MTRHVQPHHLALLLPRQTCTPSSKRCSKARVLVSRFAQDRMQRACLRLRHGALTLSGGTGSLIKDTSLP